MVKNHRAKAGGKIIITSSSILNDNNSLKTNAALQQKNAGDE